MNTDTLRTLLRARKLNQSELARRVGVSRQAVSQWLQKAADASVSSQHLAQLAEVLEVDVDTLLHPLPCQGAERAVAEAALLWDRLYPDLVEFAVAAGQWDLRAVARLVEVYGMYRTARILGSSVWKRFDEYARYLPPVRRSQLETLVRWRNTREAS